MSDASFDLVRDGRNLGSGSVHTIDSSIGLHLLTNFKFFYAGHEHVY